MIFLLLACFFVGYYPLARAWWGNRHTSLLHSVSWSIAAWTAWFLCQGIPRGPNAAGIDAPRYVALCLTGCVGVAVLGARRPHAGVWNFVVLGLLAVMVLPLVETTLIGAKSLDQLRMIFVVGTLLIGVLNYLPTTLAPAALCLALACSGELLMLHGAEWSRDLAIPSSLSMALIPWAAWWGWSRQSPSPAEFSRIWLDFRNRFGLVWGQRLREQFNRSAANAGWPVILYWQGLVRVANAALPDQETQKEMLTTLKALLKRFVDFAE